MNEQKTVKLLTLEASNYRIIKVIKLDFKKWKEDGIIEVIGDVGEGKSSLLELIAMATTGVDHIKDKSLLDKGFKSEVCLADGEHKIFMGVKVSEYTRGKKKGEPKFETYIYEKDDNGKIITEPIIDGISASAKEYSEMMSTALTFKMADMFSENQSIHRKLIEELFAKELYDLGVEKIIEEIKTKKEDRDNKRYERDRLDAAMTIFESEGYSKEILEGMSFISTDEISEEIKKLEIEKGILIENPEKDKTVNLSNIRSKGLEVVEKIRALNEKKLFIYKSEKEKDDILVTEYNSDFESLNKLKETVKIISIPDPLDLEMDSFIEKWTNYLNRKHTEFNSRNVPVEPKIISIVSGKLQLTEIYPEEYNDLVAEYKKIAEEYKKESEKETFMPDTSEIDSKINNKNDKLKKALNNNKLVERFQSWLSWIEADGVYQKEIDNLRKLYTKINTGVPGLFIQPQLTEAGRLEIWFEYNGEHDITLFKNSNKELRRLYEYSKSQRAIVGILLQAARLDKKQKVLRLAVLDDYTQTKKGKDLLEKICHEKNLTLIISKTDDKYKIEDLDPTQILIENGELLLND